MARCGPRGVLDCQATDVDDPTEDARFGRVGKQTIADTGPLTRKRMETVEDDLLAQPYAINVHESQDTIQHYIACGDLGGATMTGPAMAQGGVLAIGLRELNTSGESGIAVLRATDNNQTMVWIYLAKGLSGASGMGTPSA